jgi:hypothetical protein
MIKTRSVGSESVNLFSLCAGIKNCTRDPIVENIIYRSQNLQVCGSRLRLKLKEIQGTRFRERKREIWMA